MKTLLVKIIDDYSAINLINNEIISFICLVGNSVTIGDYYFILYTDSETIVDRLKIDDYKKLNEIIEK